MKRIILEIFRQPWSIYLGILIGKQKEDSQRAALIHGAGGTLALKIGAVILGFAVSISLTRILGSHGYGIFAYTMTWISILALISTVGLHGIIIRYTAIYRKKEEYNLLRGLIRFSTTLVLCISLIITFSSYLVLLSQKSSISLDLYQGFLILSLMIPIAAMLRIQQSFLLGFQHTVLAQLPDLLLKLLFFLALLWPAYLILGEQLSPYTALLIQVVAVGLALSMSSIWLLRKLRCHIAKTPEKSNKYQTKTWLIGALSLFFMECMQIINNKADIIMLGLLDSTKSVGIYAAAAQTSGLISIILVSANAALSPVIARLFSSGSFETLQSIITKSARIMMAISFPIAMFLIFLGHWALVIFGNEFVQGATALSILSGAQFINVAMGSVGVILVMTGHERIVACTLAAAAVINILLNSILIPKWGMNGAALASAVSLVMWNMILMFFVKRNLNIDSTALGLQYKKS